jgi:hypothetical protein
MKNLTFFPGISWFSSSGSGAQQKGEWSNVGGVKCGTYHLANDQEEGDRRGSNMVLTTMQTRKQNQTAKIKRIRTETKSRM